MTERTLKKIERTYKNNGQHLEQVYRFTLTGRIEKADNRPEPDIDNIQVKSARATVCKGTDYEQFIINDKATVYAYVMKDGSKAYEMNKTEYIEFVHQFGTVTTESASNGGSVKVRLKTESKEMVQWFESH